MAKINLDVPDKLHYQMKEEQLRLEKEGRKVNLKDMYYEVIELGLEAQKKASQK